MKKLLFNSVIIFGSAQIFIQGVTMFAGTNNPSTRTSHSTSYISNDLRVKSTKPSGTLNNIVKFETGKKNDAIASDRNFTGLPSDIAKISGLQGFYYPNMGLNNYNPFNTYNWRWRLIE